MKREMDYERQQPRTSTEKNAETAGLNDPRFRTVRTLQSKAKTRGIAGPVTHSVCPTRKANFTKAMKKANTLTERYEITYAYSILEFEILQNKLGLRGTLPSEPKHTHPRKTPKNSQGSIENRILEALKYGEQPAEIVAFITKSNCKRVESIMRNMSLRGEVLRRRITHAKNGGHWRYSLPEDSK